MSFSGLGLDLGTLSHLSRAKSRSISPENPTGGKGQGGRDTEGTASEAAKRLHRGWKISPYVWIDSQHEHVLADIRGPGAVQQMWMTPTGPWRNSILRIYWDDQEQPSVECPIGDFFASGWGQYAQISSLAVCVNPAKGFNCYWEMPFRKRCRITLQNIGPERMRLYYQVNYTLTDVPETCAYFHAQFRRVNPLPFKRVYPLLDGVKGWGHYVGTVLSWQVNNTRWWGEGEIKFYIDGDCPDSAEVAEHGGEAFPTICGTGTEDYFGGAYNFDLGKDKGGYREFTTPYTGMPLVVRPDGLYQSQTRFGLYRWHIVDPVRFETDLKVTIQALGWRSDWEYLPLQDDIASVAFWYQTLPTAPFPKLPTWEALEIN